MIKGTLKRKLKKVIDEAKKTLSFIKMMMNTMSSLFKYRSLIS